MTLPHFHIVRTDANDSNFIDLVARLDADLAKRDGKDHAFYNQFNKISAIKYAVVVYIENTAVACGAIKAFDNQCMEVKRMYVLPKYRGRGIAAKVLLELEGWTSELGYIHCVLETGKRQPEAINLYKKYGYTSIPNYGQYKGIKNSLCFRKQVVN